MEGLVAIEKAYINLKKKTTCNALIKNNDQVFTVSMSTGTPHLLALINGSIPFAILRYSFAWAISPVFLASSAACLNMF